MDMSAPREEPREEKRIQDLLSLVPKDGGSALDIGVGDGNISLALVDFFDVVTALDLEKPDLCHKRIVSVKGDVTSLDFPENSFDLVLCVEVLEHIPPPLVSQACSEIERVAKNHVIIGAPYKQDIRVGRTTCQTCGKKNPPWGHMNAFDENRLKGLFPSLYIEKMSFVGKSDSHTNFLSTFLMDLAGNPYGTYDQLETCIYCRSELRQPPERNLIQKACCKLSLYIKNMQKPFVTPHPIWMHILFKKIV